MKISCLFILLSSLCSCSSQTKSNSVSDDIVIVNAGVGNRVRLAKDIAYINSLEPRVLAIDFQFSEQQSFYGDSLLIATLNQSKNLVMSVAIKDYPDESKGYSELIGTLPEFRTKAKVGFVNLLPEQDEFETLKRFSLYEEVSGKVIYPFGVQTAMTFDSLKTMSFLKGKPKMMDVDYKGDEKVFRTVSFQNLVERKISPEVIKDKIVMLGFIGLSSSSYVEDKFYSPLNDNMEPHKPDMYGVVYHANIVAQALADK